MMLSLSLARWWRNDGILSLMAGGVHTRETDDGSAVSQMVAQQWRSFSLASGVRMRVTLSLARWWHDNGSPSLMAGGMCTREVEQ